MSKRKAKAQRQRRNKSYSGKDAAIKGTKVTRIKAVEKSAIGEWYSDNKQRLLSTGLILIVFAILILLIYFVLNLIF